MVCTYLACYLTITQTARYFENKDASSIDFKPFNDSPDDTYPTVTICFQGAEIRWYNEASIFESLEVTSPKYGQILKGEKVIQYQYNYTTRLYDRITVDIRNGSNQAFESFSLNVSDVFTGLEYATQDDKASIHYGKGRIGQKMKKIPFDVGYNTPELICFTRKSTDSVKTIRSYDWLLFNQSLFNKKMHKSINFQIFIHHPGQLLRTFYKPVFKSELMVGDKNNEDKIWDKVLKIKIEDVTVLRKRHNSNIPCDNRLDYMDDVKFLEEIMNHVGCMPIYWRGIPGQLSNFTECNSPVELSKIYYYIQNFEEVLRSYGPPCIEMKVSTKLDEKEENKWEEPSIMILYTDLYYLNIVNVQSFGFESFVSGVGGFIGIFLGYSILQIPDLLKYVRSRLRNA